MKFSLSTKTDKSSTPSRFCGTGLLLFGIILFFISTNSAEAATKYWVGATAGANTSVDTNWSTTAASACNTNKNTTVPVDGDVVYFTTSCKNSATVDSALNVTDFYITTGYTGTITESAGVTITVSGVYSQVAGTVANTATGNMNFTGDSQSFTVSAGTFNSNLTFSGTGTTLVSSGGTHSSGITTIAQASGIVALATTTNTFYDLVINSGSVLDASPDSGVTSKNFLISNTFTNNAGATGFVARGGTVTFMNASTTMTTGGVTFYNLTLAGNRTGTTNLADSFTVSNALTVANTNNIVTWAATSAIIITLQGNFSEIAGGSGLSFGTNITLNMTGPSSSFTMTSGTFNANLNFSGNNFNMTAGTLGTNITINMTGPSSSFTMTGGTFNANLNFSGNNFNIIAGSFGGNLTFSGTGTTLLSSGGTHSSGTTTIAQASGIVALATTTNTFYNLVINSGSVLDVSPDGGVTSENLIINYTFTNNAGASGFVARSGTVTFSHYSVSPTITTGGVTFYNLTLTNPSDRWNSGNTNFADSFTVSNELTISPTVVHTWSTTGAITITLQGSFTQTSGTLIFGTNITLNMTGANQSFTVSAGTFNSNLTFSGTGTTLLSSGGTHSSGTTTIAQASGIVALATTTNTFYDLVINSGSVLDASPDSGATSENLTINNIFTNNAGASGFVARSGTVTFSHSSTVTPTITTGGVAFYNLILTSGNNGYTTNLADSFTVSNALTIPNTGGVHTWSTTGAITITLQGSFTQTGAGTLIFGTNITLNMTGANQSFTVTAGTFNSNLTFSGTGTTTVIKGGSATAGTTTIAQASGSVVLATTTNTFYNLVINSGSVLDVSPDGGVTSENLTINHIFTNNAGASGLVARSGTVTFYHSNVSPTMTTGGVTFYNLTLADPSNRWVGTTLADSFTVSNTLTISDLVNDLHTWSATSTSPITITLQGSFTMGGRGAQTFGPNITLNMTGANQSFTTTASTFKANLIFSGTGTTSVNARGTWSAGTTTIAQASGSVVLATTTNTFYNLNVATGTLNINANNLTVNNNFLINAGGTFQLQGGETVSKCPTSATGGIVDYNGTSASYTIKACTYSVLNIDGGASSVFTSTSTLSLATTTINTGILSLNGNNFTTTNLVNNSTLRMRGDESVTISTSTPSGTIEYVGNGNSTTTAYTINPLNYYNLDIASVDSMDTYLLPSILTVGGNLSVTGGILNEEPGGLQTFTTVGTSTFSVPANVNSLQVLVVGGGGGGGRDQGGGGGGGQVVSTTSFAVTPGNILNIVVGAGGANGTSGWASSGATSSFSTISAIGGTGGYSATFNVATRVGGNSGGGYIGGNGSNPLNTYGGGGGAGDSANGQSPTSGSPKAGDGGAGTLSSISGSSVCYGGGGGGGNRAGTGQGLATCGGGNGGNNANGTVGATSTGGGGGGGAWNGSVYAGAPGGSGVVIVNYTPPQGGANTINLSGNLSQTVGTITFINTAFVLNGTNQTISLTGTTTFASLIAGSTTVPTALYFNTTGNLLITGTTTLKGAENNLLTLRSTSGGDQWYFQPDGGRDFAYLDVQDSNNTSSTTIDVVEISGFVDSGNNTGWGQAVSLTIVSKQGSQVATTTIPIINKDLGGAFTFSKSSGEANVTSITLHQDGSFLAEDITNLKLYYKKEDTCSATKPEDAELFGDDGTFVNNFATTTGTLPVSASTTCLYITYNIPTEYTELSLGKSIDLEITNPSTNVVVSSGTVSPATSINIVGNTIIVADNITNVTATSTSNPACSDSRITSILSIHVRDEDKNPTVFYLKNCAVWKKEGEGNPFRLTDPNLQVHSLVFTNIGMAGRAVQIELTMSNMDPGNEGVLLNVVRTYRTFTTVQAWSGN